MIEYKIKYKNINFKNRNNDKIKKYSENIINHLIKELTNVISRDISLENKIKNIISKMGVTNCFIYNDSINIQYSRYVDIIIENSTKQLERALKLNFLLENE